MPINDNWFEIERLHRAAADGDIAEMARLAAAGYGLDVFDEFGFTPLHYAVEGKHCEAAEWLLQQGARVNANDEAMIGETPLALAVQGDCLKIVELLLVHGADPDVSGWMMNTARLRAGRRDDATGKEIFALIQRCRPGIQALFNPM